MPRHHRRKTTRWINEDCMQSAVTDICNGIETPSTAARKYGLKRTTIIYRVERKQKMDLARGNNTEVKFTPQPVMQIFTPKQEKELMEFLNRYTYLPYDPSSSYKAARQLVYQFVKTHDIKHPKLWDIEQQAGVDWLYGFIQRNPQTNLKKPSADNSPDKFDGDEDDESLSDTDIKLPFPAQINKTETDTPPLEELPLESICKNMSLPEPSLESDISNTYTFEHFLDSNPLRAQRQAKPESCEDADEQSEIEIEPECDILFPIVSIKQESETNTDEIKARDESDSKADIPKLDTIPVDDDVFNSFGRNIAFQVKELYRLNRLDAYELMHEVQATVNRRLTKKLRLIRNEENSIRTSAMLLPRVIQIDDDDDV